jgi:hypothetical protein
MSNPNQAKTMNGHRRLAALSIGRQLPVSFRNPYNKLRKNTTKERNARIMRSTHPTPESAGSPEASLCP